MHNGHLLVLKLKLQEGGHFLFNVEVMDRHPPFGTGSFKHPGRAKYQPYQHTGIPVSRMSVLLQEQVRS